MRFTFYVAALAVALLPTLAFAAEPAVDSDSDPSAPSGRSGQATDTDGDGLTDSLELAFGSNPNVADTDGDGYADGVEVNAGYSPTDAAPNPLEKKIVIDLSDQKLARYLGDVQLDEFSVSTGRPGMSTPVGEFNVLNKHPKAWSRMAGLWMPYWMAFTTRGHGIHELPIWPGGYREGEDHLGTPVSHGCVRLGVGAAETLYDWAPVGTKVVVRK